MVAGVVIVSVALAASPVRQLDLALRDLADAHRPPIADTMAQILNGLGSGGILTGITLALALLLGWRTRSAWPLAPVLAAFLLTGIVIQPLKLFFDRAAPHSTLPDDIEVRLFSQPGGLSYPSGHAVNTVVWYGVIALLLAAMFRARAGNSTIRRWLRWAPPVIVGLAGTYLGYHWLTDMLAGFCLGVLIDRALARTPWPSLTDRERPSRS
jgi:membrane-associated phospholipid phosphatase